MPTQPLEDRYRWQPSAGTTGRYRDRATGRFVSELTVRGGRGAMMKDDFRRVRYDPPRQEVTEHCPECGGGLVFGNIPCPEGLAGCLVAHFGWACISCGAIWVTERDA